MQLDKHVKLDSRHRLAGAAGRKTERGGRAGVGSTRAPGEGGDGSERLRHDIIGVCCRWWLDLKRYEPSSCYMPPKVKVKKGLNFCLVNHGTLPHR